MSYFYSTASIAIKSTASPPFCLQKACKELKWQNWQQTVTFWAKKLSKKRVFQAFPETSNETLGNFPASLKLGSN